MHRSHITQTLLILSLLPTAACNTKPGELGGVGEGTGGGDAEGTDATIGVSATSNGDGVGDSAGEEAGDTEEDTGEPPQACTTAIGVSRARVLDAHKWTNAVADLLDVVPPAAPIAAEATVGPFYVGFPSSETTESFATAATDVAMSLGDGFVECGDVDDDACLTQLVDSVAAQAWRRSITDAETAMFLALPGGSLDERGRAVVQTVLASPEFYDITETGSADPDDPTRIMLDRRAIATRLAHLVWNSVPDAALLERATSGALSDPQARREEVQRMWADPRAYQMVDDYIEQWLGLGRLRTNDKEIVGWTEDFPQAMLDEVGLFAARVIIEQGGTWGDLLTAPFSVVNGPLAQLVYGEDIVGPLPGGDAFEVVALDPARRSGILSLSGPMSAWSGQASIGISRRGYAILDRLVCVVVPPEPIDTNPDLPDGPADSRHEYQQNLFGNNSCAGCHDLFDPTSFAFDNYDALGRWQTELSPAGGLAGGAEQDVPVEPYGSIFLPSEGAVDFETRAELLTTLQESTDVKRCVVMQQTRFAFGRDVSAENCMVQELLATFDDSGATFDTLVEDIAAHEDFVTASFE